MTNRWTCNHNKIIEKNTVLAKWIEGQQWILFTFSQNDADALPGRGEELLHEYEIVCWKVRWSWLCMKNLWEISLVDIRLSYPDLGHVMSPDKLGASSRSLISPFWQKKKKKNVGKLHIDKHGLWFICANKDVSQDRNMLESCRNCASFPPDWCPPWIRTSWGPSLDHQHSHLLSSALPIRTWWEVLELLQSICMICPWQSTDLILGDSCREEMECQVCSNTGLA